MRRRRRDEWPDGGALLWSEGDCERLLVLLKIEDRLSAKESSFVHDMGLKDRATIHQVAWLRRIYDRYCRPSGATVEPVESAVRALKVREG